MGATSHWRNLLDRLTISSVRLPDEAIYVPLGRKTPIGKPGGGEYAQRGGQKSYHHPPGRTWTRLWSRLYNEKAMDSPWVT